jgi:hypothetical protein
MTRIKTRLIQGAVLGILGLLWATLGATPLFAAGVGNQCSGQFLFKMNIIGVDNPKTAKLNNTDRKTIFVALGDKGAPVKSNIFLTQGPFSVCDGNSWDQAYNCQGEAIGNLIGSVFQLPCNLNVQTTTVCTGFSACYSVWFRALGTPTGNNGGTTITTCGITSTGDTICSSNNTGLISRNTGKPKFTDVTKALTSLECPATSFCAGQTLPLFNNQFEFFLWQYNNQGLRNGMVVFCGETTCQ